MELFIAISTNAVLCVVAGWLVWQRRKAREAAERDAAIIDAQAGELQAAHQVMRLQSDTIYDMACQLHGKAAADRTILEAHKRGEN